MGQERRVVVERVGAAGVELAGVEVRRLRAVPVVLGAVPDEPEDEVPVRDHGVDLERAQHRGLGGGNRLVGTEHPVLEPEDVGLRDPGEANGALRVLRERVAEMPERVQEPRVRPRVEPVLRHDVPLPAARDLLRGGGQAVRRGRKDLAGERAGGVDRDLALQRELVHRVPFPRVGPQERAAGDLDELGPDADASVHPAQRSVEHPLDAELPPDPVGAPIPVAVPRDRVRRDHADAVPEEPAEPDDHLLRETLAERLVRGVGGRVGEGENGEPAAAVVDRRDDFGGVRRGEEAIAAPGEGLNEPRVGRRVPECLPQLVDGGIEAVIEVDERVGRPQRLAELLPGHDLVGPRQERDEDPERPLLEADPGAAPPQLTGVEVGLEHPEPDDAPPISRAVSHEHLDGGGDCTGRLPRAATNRRVRWRRKSRRHLTYAVRNV